MACSHVKMLIVFYLKEMIVCLKYAKFHLRQEVTKISKWATIYKMPVLLYVSVVFKQCCIDPFCLETC